MSEPTPNHRIFEVNGFTCAIIQRAPITDEQIEEVRQNLLGKSKADKVNIEIQCQAKNLEDAIEVSQTICRDLIEVIQDKARKEDDSENPFI